jgi:hypothetical protein
MSEYGVVLVHTTSAALRGEKILQQAGLTVKLIPVPRELSSDCGIALRFLWEEREAVEDALDAVGLELAGVHRLS